MEKVTNPASTATYLKTSVLRDIIKEIPLCRRQYLPIAAARSSKHAVRFDTYSILESYIENWSR